MPDANALIAQLLQFSSDKRLYALELGGADDSSASLGTSGLLVEAFVAVEGLHQVGARDVVVLSTSAHIELKTLIGRQASLVASLSDGTRTRFTGLIQQAAQLGSEGGLARYRLRIVPWLWMLGQVRSSRVWQDHSVQDIIDSVLAAYPQHAAWAWSSDATAHLGDAPVRSYCIQYRESDLAFVERLLAEEGLTWRVEEAPDAIKGHQVVFIADTTQTSACPQDPSSAHALGANGNAPAGQGIRFHAAGSREEQDSIQALVAQRSLHASLVSLLSFDYKAKQSITTSVPTTQRFGSKSAPALESYDTPGLYAWPSAFQATRYATQHMQALEASSQTWLGHSTVRTLRPGTQFTLTQGPLKNQPSAYTVLRVASLGINNLPKPAQQSLAELFGALPELLQASLQELLEPQETLAGQGKLDVKSASGPHGACANSCEFHSELFTPAVITKATTLGYANTFEALDAAAPWRAILADGTGSRAHPRATAWGSQSAIVVDANGSTQPSGADEIYCDKLGRVRIQFHWQAQGEAQNTNASCWVRVAQRAAGAGRGLQFIPRIGQEVLVQFLEGDIDRPIILGALYNGQGEGGIAPTPAGQTNTDSNTNTSAENLFASAHDHQSSAQGNLLGAAGAAPAWHGASAGSADTGGMNNAGGHGNASAQWGIRSKEFGASALGASAGYNQLLLDDSAAEGANQGRIQLKTTQAATELNLGHLIHSADNYRGSLRGTGAELRTDAYGAVRAGAGLLITSYALNHNPANRDPAGDNAPGMALLKQAATLAQTFSQAAATHQTVALASAQGSTAANASALDANAKQHAPIKALHTAASGMVSGQSYGAAQSHAADKNTSTANTGAKDSSSTDTTIPHSTDPILGISAQGGLAAVAGQSLQLANGETISLMSGQNSQYLSGGQLRIHTGQAIGLLGGVVKPGDANTGVQLIAAQDKIDIQAQASTLKVQAKDAITIQSASGQIDWAAAKKISISTAGGANITIEGGNITVQCPGKLTVHASVKNFEGPGAVNYQLPIMPKSVCLECLAKRAAQRSAFINKGV